VRGVYNRYDYADEKADALQRLAAKIETMSIRRVAMLCRLPAENSRVETRLPQKNGELQMLKWGVALVVGIGSLLTVTLGTAAMEEYPGSIAALRLYLIWDDNGEMSKDLSHQRQIIATSRRHTQIQARVDIVLEGHKGAMGNISLEVSPK
jgi:hypothetical protein